MIRNGGFRTLTFSEWNGGTRAMTNPYWRGDSDADFRLGGSFFTLNTERGRELPCEDPTEIFHRYYSHNSNGVEEDLGNGCQREETDIFVRPRLLPSITSGEE